jgi:hypothetical protein
VNANQVFAWRWRYQDGAAEPAELRLLPVRVTPEGLSQTFSDQYASVVRGRDDLTFGFGLGFLATIFLSLVALIQVRQSAIILQIGRGKNVATGPS